MTPGRYTVRALTLRRPWPYCIFRLGKRIENRTHAQFKRYRGWLLIHAGKGWSGVETPPGVAWDNPLRLVTRSAHPVGIVGRVHVVAHVTPEGRIFDDPQAPRFGGAARGRITRGHPQWGWWARQHGLLFDSAEALDEPVPCSGQLGLWRPAPWILEQLPAHWRAA